MTSEPYGKYRLRTAKPNGSFSAVPNGPKRAVECLKPNGSRVPNCTFDHHPNERKRQVVYDTLVTFRPPELDVVIFRLDLPTQLLLPKSAYHSARVIEVIEMMERDAHGLCRLRQEMGNVRHI